MLGVTVIDWRDRAKLRADLIAADNLLKAAAEKLAITHNALVTAMQALQDQVNSHELKLSGVGAAKAQPWAARPV